MKPIIAPSLFAASSSNFGEAVQRVEKAGAEYLHIDVMDGHFVPNLSFGPNIVEGLRPVSNLYFDVHLMVTNPEKYALPFIKAGADSITVHAEVPGNIEEVIKICEENNISFGISLKPNTAIESYKSYFPKCSLILIMSVEPGYGGQKFIHDAVKRIESVKQIREKLGVNYKISVDGGINPETAALCINAGVDILVAGTAVFNADDPKLAINQLLGR